LWYQPQKTLWIGQPDMTIDQGRDGALSITQLGAGLTTMLDEWGERGAFWQDKIDQRVLETAYAKRKCAEAGVEPHEAFPRLFLPPMPEPVAA
jgi:capsid protein